MLDSPIFAPLVSNLPVVTGRAIQIAARGQDIPSVQANRVGQAGKNLPHYLVSQSATLNNRLTRIIHGPARISASRRSTRQSSAPMSPAAWNIRSKRLVLPPARHGHRSSKASWIKSARLPSARCLEAMADPTCDRIQPAQGMSAKRDFRAAYKTAIGIECEKAWKKKLGEI